MADFPLTDPFREKIAEFILRTPTEGQNRARMAIRHLERAWIIRAVDPEMSTFRAITAEEEAATALIYSLHRHRYPGAQRLHGNRHIHKATFIPFMEIVWKWLASQTPPDLEVIIEQADGGERFNIQIPIKLRDSRTVYATPSAPFDGELRLENAKEPAELAKEIEALSNDTNVRLVAAQVRERANLRNEILYASAAGLPSLSIDVESFLVSHAGQVFRVLAIYLLIDQYKGPQAFAVQLTKAYVQLVKAAEGR